MKAVVVLLVLPLALAFPDWQASTEWQKSGWGNSGGQVQQQNDDQDHGIFKFLMEMMEKRREGKDEGEKEGHMLEGMNLEELFMHFKKEQEDDSGDRDMMQNSEMMKQFMKFREHQMEKAREEREKEEHQRKAMEALYQKQVMVQKLGELAEKFQHQKLKLVHDVTFQFLEFCKCADTSAMMKRFFEHEFGSPRFDQEWSEAMDKLGGDWSAWEYNEEWNHNMGSMQNQNGSTNGNGTFFGNGTMGNSTYGDDHDIDPDMRAQWLMAVRKFSVMTPKQQAKDLFKGLVKGLCERAGEYVAHVRKFEAFYIKMKSGH